MSRLTKLNRLVRKSFKHLNRVQTGTAFVRHYFLVVEHSKELNVARDMQLINRKRANRTEYALA